MRIPRSISTPTPQFASPFAPLQLAAEDEAQLEAVAQLFVRNTVVQYERFLEQKRQVSNDHWKCIKHERDLRVFLQRRKKDVDRRQRRRLRLRSLRQHGANIEAFSDSDGSFASLGSRDSSCSSIASTYGGRSVGSFASVNSNTNSSDSSWTSTTSDVRTSNASSLLGVELPVLQLVGSVPGSLDDALFGALGATTESMRVKSAYEHDNTTNCAVLATITAPSTDHPFRSLTIKWLEQGGSSPDHRRSHPLHYPISLPREDLVFLEATGTTTLSTGERVAFQLRHSVHFPQTLARHNVQRGNMSTCLLFREGDAANGCLEVFARACLSGGNSAVRATAQTMAGAGRVVLCGRMKKLAWLLTQRQPPQHPPHAHQHMQQLLGLAAEQADLMALTRSLPVRKRESVNRNVNATAPTTVTISAAAAAATCSVGIKRCVTCKKRPTWFSVGGEKKKAATTCQLCLSYVCSSCRLKKTVVSCVPPTSREQTGQRPETCVVQREVTLCNICVHHAMVATSACDVAREEIEADPKRWRQRVTLQPVAPSFDRASHGYSHPQLLATATSRVTGVHRPASSISLRSGIAVRELIDRRARHH
ncbi:hypothetical protein BBJ28_00022492 [Nothophytophthora sp. Chile5]|nr:hypothetical protein BBJ28_00022492 [Nothophytophthora sp. Chile5]